MENQIDFTKIDMTSVHMSAHESPPWHESELINNIVSKITNTLLSLLQIAFDIIHAHYFYVQNSVIPNCSSLLFSNRINYNYYVIMRISSSIVIIMFVLIKAALTPF